MSERETIYADLEAGEYQRILVEMETAAGTAQITVDPNKPLSHSLPGINREMRLIVGQLPGMRSAMQYYFRLSRAGRAFDKLKEGKSLDMWLTGIATAIILLQQFARLYQEHQRREREYETLIRGYRGWTHEQYLKARREEETYFRRMPG